MTTSPPVPPSWPTPEAGLPLIRTTAKVLIAGGYGAGKTTFVTTISDIDPVSTEEPVTLRREPASKVDTTVALDFGRVGLEDGLLLYLFGMPGQERFRFMWEDLAVGAIGAVILVDTDHLEGSFGSIDFFEQVGLPFLVSVNCFEGIARHQLSEIRDALAVPVDVPVLYTDARSRSAAKQTLVALTEHAMRRRSPEPERPADPDAPGIFGSFRR